MGDLLIEDDGRLRILRLNRPERKNALTGQVIDAIADAVLDAAADDDVWAIAITGNGDAFCSGLDLEQAAGPAREAHDAPPAPAAPDGDREVEASSRRHFAAAMRVDCEKPILAGVNGVAVGIGVSLAMAADIRIAAPAARFHPGYARLATSPDGGGTITVTQALGYERALRFFLESRMVGAEEALDIGLVSEVTESDDAFHDRFLEYGRMLAAVAPFAARQTKRMLVRASMLGADDIDRHLVEEISLALHGLSTEDAAEGIRAMLARERPTFHGR